MCYIFCRMTDGNPNLAARTQPDPQRFLVTEPEAPPNANPVPTPDRRTLADLPPLTVELADFERLVQLIDELPQAPAGHPGALFKDYKSTVRDFRDAQGTTDVRQRSMAAGAVQSRYMHAVVALRELATPPGSAPTPSARAPVTPPTLASVATHSTAPTWPCTPVLFYAGLPLGKPQVPPANITDGMMGITLAVEIQARIPEADRTPSMLEVQAGTGELCGLARRPNPAREREVSRAVLAAYPKAWAEAREYLAAPERQRAVVEARNEAMKRALQVLDADASPANSIEPSTTVPTGQPSARGEALRSEVVLPAADIAEQMRRFQAAADRERGVVRQETPAAEEPVTSSTLSEGETRLVPLQHLVVAPVRRARADKTHVTRLAESIGTVGLQNAVVVDVHGNIISGVHRVMAHEVLGLTHVLAHVSGLADQEKRLAEIDENLVRRTLSALELAELTLERKELYEALHPEAKQYIRGGHAKSARKNGSAATAFVAVAASFANDTKKKTGQAERTTRRYAEVAAMPAHIRDAVRDTPVAHQITELASLNKLPAAEQTAVAKMLAKGEVKKVAEARKVLQAAQAPTLSYAAMQDPVALRQRSALEKLAREFHATADEWEENDPTAMQPYAAWNRSASALLLQLLAAAPPVGTSMTPTSIVMRKKKTPKRKKAAHRK